LPRAPAGVADGDERVHDGRLFADVQSTETLLDLVADFGGALQVRTFGRLQRNLELARIVGRNEVNLVSLPSGMINRKQTPDAVMMTQR
jgi:hypothetical protein